MKLIENEIKKAREGFERFVAEIEKWLEETDPERKEDHE